MEMEECIFKKRIGFEVKVSLLVTVWTSQRT